MKYLDLLGSNLKMDILCDLFETYDTDVIYQYDRVHEGASDEFHAHVSDLGLQFIFDEQQELRTLFIEQVEINTFNPFHTDTRIPSFHSKAEAINYAEQNEAQITEGQVDFMGELKDWIRIDYDIYSLHYEFIDSTLKMITLQHKT